MNVISYGAEICNAYHIIDGTVAYFRSAVDYLVSVLMPHYGEITSVPVPDGHNKQQYRQRFMESLVHSTEKNTAVYPEFDRRFYKFPSYLRRSAINTAFGLIDSYKKQISLWEQSGCSGKRPRLNIHQAQMPCFYNGNMFTHLSNGTRMPDEEEFNIKVWHNHDWIWIPIVLKTSDMRYIKDNCAGLKPQAPVLEKHNHHYELRFSFGIPKSVSEQRPKFVKDEDATTVLGVDLGLNSDAVCSVMRKDGTVTGRKFIDHPVEKDRLYTDLCYIRKAQYTGKCQRLWRFVNNYNRTISTDTARQIVSFAVESHVQVIVLEYLDFKGRIHGSKAQRISLWRKRDIAHRVEALAARFGIRVSYICAWGTSALAYDGSGRVKRDGNNHALCTFKTGKRYNCDLSASYNIGARYFIRVIQKTTTEKQWLQLSAKVPEACKRTTATLATLISLAAVQADSSVCAEA